MKIKFLLFISTFVLLQSAFAQFSLKGYDICTTGASDPSSMIVYNGNLYFSALDNSSGRELWVSNGSTNSMVKDINTGGTSNPQYLTKNSSRLFFAADDGTNGTELWLSDGTPAGTKLVKDIFPGMTGSDAKQLTAYAERIIFAANSPLYGNELFISDGTDTGTKMVLDINTGSANSNPGNFYVFNGKVYFSAEDAVNGIELWVTDGTAAGTQMLKDIYTGIGNSSPSAFTECNGKLFFTADSGPLLNGQELWITDGTAPGTQMVKDINPLSAPGFMGTGMIAYNNKVYLAGNDPVNGIELFVSDGTTAGTQMLKDIYSGGDGFPKFFCVFNGKLYFNASTAAGGSELWVTDGTLAGTTMAADIFTGTSSSDPRSLTAYGNYLVLSAKLSPSDRALFVSDGTSAGTKTLVPVGATYLDPISVNAIFTIYNSSVYFAAKYDSKDNELWSLRDTVTYGSVGGLVHQADFLLYPNPNNGTFSIEIKNNFKNANIEVYDMMGREVYHSAITKQQTQLTLDAPKGVYTLKLQLDDTIVARQLIIQ